MKKILLLLLIGTFLSLPLFAGEVINSDGEFDVVLTVEEEDGSPTVYTANTIKFTNATVTDNADGTVSVDTSGITLTEEQVEDYVGGMLGGTETLISVDYQDGTGDIDFVVTDRLNTITTPDAGVTAGTAITFADTGIMTITESADTITFDATEVDGSTSNEINTLT